jgi:hypothetical protein
MRFLILSTILGVLGVAPAHAQSLTGVFPVQGTNLAPGEMDAIGTVIAVSYASQSGTRVLSPAQTTAALEEHPSTLEAARSLGLGQYIEIQAVRLGVRITVQASLYDKNGGLLYQVKTTATSMDDMEPVADRIAAGLIRRTPLDQTRTRTNVIGNETHAPNRLFAEKVFGVRTGVVFPFARHLDTNASLTLEFDGRLESDAPYFLEFAAGFMLPSTSSDSNDGIGGLTTMLGASYYLGDGNVAPYIGGGSPRIMLGSYEGVALTAHAQFGIMLMRWSSSRLYMELGIDQHVIGLRPEGYGDDSFDSSNGVATGSDPDDPDKVWPTEFSVHAGIGW